MEKNERVCKSTEPKYRGVKAMPFVIGEKLAGNETFEKLGTIGTSSNLLVYLTTVFNMNSITATNIINIFNGTCNFGTLLGAFLSDTYLGRYKTLGIASVSSFLGMLVLTLTAAISKLHPPDCGTNSKCIGPSAGQMAFLLTGFGLLIAGASGIRPCNLAFGADQFNPNTESGRRRINSFFNWYYFTFTFAMMVSLTIIVYVQSDVNWALGLAIPAFLMFLSCTFFFVGTRIYVKVIPKGSPLASVAQVMVTAVKKRKLKLPEQPWVSLFDHISSNSINSKLPYTDQFRFLSKAAIVTPEDKINTDGSAADPWRLCSIQQVEEVKCLVRVIPIWVACIIYFVSLVQQQTYVVFQALQSDRRFGHSSFKIPAASYSVFQMLSLTIWIPIYDRLIVPLLRKLTKKEAGITILQKMGIGMFLSVFTMILSALVENRRRTVALTKPTVGFEPRKGDISSMSGLWLVAQLGLAGFSEAFAIIGETEFFYKQFPENMRSFGGSVLFCGLAMSSYLSSFLISIVHHVTRNNGGGNWLAEDLNKGRLDYFYYLIAALEGYKLSTTVPHLDVAIEKTEGILNARVVPQRERERERERASWRKIMEMEKNGKVAKEPMEKDEKVSATNEPNYRGIKAMPFVIGKPHIHTCSQQGSFLLLPLSSVIFLSVVSSPLQFSKAAYENFAGNETFEKLGTIGTSSNLLVYLTTVFHMNSFAATNLLNIFNGTSNFGTLVGAFLSDTYFGRYKTLGFASVSSFLVPMILPIFGLSSFYGMLALTLTAAMPQLHPHSCGKGETSRCEGPNAGQMAFLLGGFALLIVGASGIRPCNLAFGADQFNPNSESGRRGTNSFFNWYYLTYTFAVMVSMTAVVYLQSNVSWSLGLAIPTLLMFLSCALFFGGTKIYVIVMPEGSPLKAVAQVIVAATKKRGLKLPEQPWLSLFDYTPTGSINLNVPHTDQFRFLSKAAIISPEDEINSDGSAANPWRLCSVQQVEQLKCLLRLFPVWVACLVYGVFLVQQSNYMVFQALQCDRRLGSTSFKIPAATYIVFAMLTLTIWLPIYDRIVVPFLRRLTGRPNGITLLQRMGVGILLSILSLIVSALVETQRRTLALTEPTLGFEPRKGAISSMSGLWFIPQLVLAGLSEAFFFVGQNELFYSQSPENMRSMAASFVFCAFAGSSYFSSFLASVVQSATRRGAGESWLAEDLNKGRLDYFYYLVAGLEALNLGYFLVCSKWYKYKRIDNNTSEVAMEDMQSGKPDV
ncbi:hypothetical protein RJ639_032567 [Escallonia herrerae]|uniref:Uncharacterized protein n=1 Tax=Escallonia herrerae TaxID=1293975 RepID=A0AA88X4U0_9ASTE|nr:hypothetical protein RJ639_032567 [Escallonia herrerae]